MYNRNQSITAQWYSTKFFIRLWFIKCSELFYFLMHECSIVIRFDSIEWQNTSLVTLYVWILEVKKYCAAKHHKSEFLSDILVRESKLPVFLRKISRSPWKLFLQFYSSVYKLIELSLLQLDVSDSAIENTSTDGFFRKNTYILLYDPFEYGPAPAVLCSLWKSSRLDII